MKFDVATLKTKTDEAIEGVFKRRAATRDAAQEKLAKISPLSPVEIKDWEAWAEDLLAVVRGGATPSEEFLTRGRPKTLDDKAGSQWSLRNLQQDAKRKVDTTTVPGRLKRFKGFLEMCNSDEVSTNELKTHGFHNLESMFDPANYN